MIQKPNNTMIVPIQLRTRVFHKEQGGPDYDEFLEQLGPLGDRISGQVVLTVFLECYTVLFEADNNIDGPGLYAHLSTLLLSKRLWTWELDELVRRVLEFFSSLSELTGTENRELQQELTGRFQEILEKSSLNTSLLPEELGKTLLKAYNNSDRQIILDDLITSVESHPDARTLSPEILKKCVEEFVSVLVRKGYLSFSED